MSDIVLVHGLWHQGAHLEPLANALRRRDHRVHTPDLHRGSLEEDTAAVQAIVDECDEPPLVLGHSYGGAVITGLERIAALVYLAAYVPDTGESCASLGGALINDAMHRHPEGGTILDAAAARTTLYARSDDAIARWASALLVRQAAGHGRGIPSRIAWRDSPSLYIVCSQDHAVDPEMQRQMAARCARVIEIEADHSPYIATPELIAELVDIESRLVR